ncbi:hypothetical protein GQ54DRAFT_296128 [Martensiomyces pterosporus]|nr:hypothetical protein GQ54DRAFT_296128 [Martensiomyces pterosporus]
MSESFTTQGNDYLPTHHTQTSTSRDEPASSSTSSATPQFLSTQNTQAFQLRDPAQAREATPPSDSDSECSAANTGAASTSASSTSPLSPLVANDACVTAISPAAAAAAPACISRVGSRIIDINAAVAAAPSTAVVSSPSSSPEFNSLSSDLRRRSAAASSCSWPSISASAANAVDTSALAAASGGCAPGSTATTGSLLSVAGAAETAAVVRRGIKRRGSDSSIILMAVGGSAGGSKDSAAVPAYAKRTYRAKTATLSRKRRSATGSGSSSAAPAALGRRGSGSGGSPRTPVSPAPLRLPTLVVTHAATESLARGGVSSSNLCSAHSLLRTRDSRSADCLSGTPALQVHGSNNGSKQRFSPGSQRASPAVFVSPPATAAGPPTAAATTAGDRALSFSSPQTMPAAAPRAAAAKEAKKALCSAVSTADGLPHTAATPAVTPSTAQAAPKVAPQASIAPCGGATAAAAVVAESAPNSTIAAASTPPPASAPAPAPAPTAAATAVTQQQSAFLQPPAIARPYQKHPEQHPCALPPINRYTLRELKIQNILQNPRLRHEVLFEPKLEFRPNSSGHLADAKQRAAMQYWAVVEHGLQGWTADGTSSGACARQQQQHHHQGSGLGMSAIPMLLIELREILAEMSEDSPRAELTQYAHELRERLDEERLRRQIEHSVFDPVPVVVYIADVMRQFAQPERCAAIDRLVSYVRRGRFVKALRAAFDVLEAIKIDIANHSIEMYREYMRSTAVAFERSHFNLALRRNSIQLEDTAEWWRKALASGKKYHISLDDIFFEASRELILDDGQAVPGLFRMDEGRVHAIRRELERLAIVGVVFLAFAQFLQIAGRNSPPPQPQSRGAGGPSSPATSTAGGEFKNASGRVDFERLAAECMLLVPEGCSVQWSESLIVPGASSLPLPASQQPPFADKSTAAGLAARGGEVSFTRLVTELVSLAERALGRAVSREEVEVLERTLLRSARYECPLREIVEERVNSTIRTHTQALASLNGKLKGNEWEAMPSPAKELLRRSMLGFLAPGLAALSIRIHAVASHHWYVYKAFYSSLSSPSSAKCQ